jgi:uracil-DNA glycosylase
MLWGNCAKTKEQLITNKNHYILKTVHPSPLSATRGFFGCKHFSKANEILGNKKIDWQIENVTQ